MFLDKTKTIITATMFDYQQQIFSCVKVESVYLYTSMYIKALIYNLCVRGLTEEGAASPSSCLTRSLM